MAPIELTDLTATYGRLVGIGSLPVAGENCERGGFLGLNDGCKLITFRMRRDSRSPTSKTVIVPVLVARTNASKIIGLKRELSSMSPGSPTRIRVLPHPLYVKARSLVFWNRLIALSSDPGWTPLFLNAAGMVVEVGGQISHGALVAREYGLPVVVSVSEATRRIETGQRVRIDGTQGIVEIIDDDN